MEYCKNLSESNNVPSARIIAQAFQAAQNEWFEENSDGKPWNAVLGSCDIIKKIDDFQS